jgi:diguanylate cyclase (GGDEF)-like protein/PAS domain S-box-containing protein
VPVIDSSPASRAERLQALHAASLRLLDLLTVPPPEEKPLLQQAVESLAALVGARYGAIGVLDDAGEPAQFVYTGIAAEDAARIGQPPEGRGLLGVVTHENRALRLADLTKDPRAAGFPPHHPRMKSLLAVPVAHAGRAYGRVYLSEKQDGAPFTEEDEQLVARFADMLALAIRFHRAGRMLRDHSAQFRAIADAMGVYLQSGDWRQASAILVRFALAETQSEYGFAGVLTEDNVLRVLAHEGVQWHAATDREFYERALKTYEEIGYLEFTDFENLFGRVVTSGSAVVSNRPADDPRAGGLPPGHPPLESFLGVPMRRGDQVVGIIGVANRPGGYGEAERTKLETLAQTVGVLYDSYRRQQREEALGRARAVAEKEMRQLASAVAQTADSIVITDADGIIEYVNPAFERITGYTAQEAVGRKPNLVRSGLHDDAFYRRLWQTIRQGEPFRDIFINRRKGGALYFEEKTITPLKDAGGRITQFVSTGKNITERMQAEIALHESERRYHAMAEISPVGIFRADADGKCLYVNRRWCEIAGMTPEEARGDGWARGLHPEDRARIAAEWQRAVREGRRFQAEYRYRTPAGAVTWVLGQAVAERDDHGHVGGYIGTVTDITERKQAEEALARATSEWINSMDFLEDALCLVDLDDRVVRANRAFYRLTGLPPARVIGQDIGAVMHPQDEATPCPVCAARRARRDATIVMEADHPNNPARRPIEVAVRIVRDARDRPISVLLGIRDLTRARRQETELRQSRARLLEAQRMAQLGNWDLDLTNNTLAWSDEIYRIFEIDPAKFGASYEAFLGAIHPDDRERVNRAYTESVKNKTPYDIEHRLLMKDGRVKHVHERGETFYDDAGKPLRSVGTVQDITERKRTEEQLNYLAYYDTLTGLPNRALLLERLRQAAADADRVHRLVAVMFLDLDRFKYINDTLGHHVGDGLLKSVAGRLRDCVRPGDTIARLGGDELAVVLANVAHVDDVARVARKLIDSFARPFQVEGHELFTTASIGITLYPFDERDAEGLLKNADTAMYHAKERGRNTFQYFTAELNARAERRLRIETALRTALERNELSLHYQPQVDLKSGRIVGMEALARWTHPALGNVPPTEFIPVAEETGLILPIGEWVLRQACRQIKAWHESGFHKLQIAVNLSGKQLRQKDFPERVREILRETKLESRYLDLELTESLLMVDTEETAGITHALRALGVSFSVDDFGTGYSSLAYLKRFPIDVLKIDRSFVRDIATDPNDVAIVKTVIAMAHTLGMRVIAEGVETFDQLEFLRHQGCDGTQGYYCSAPLSAEEFSELLVDWKRVRASRCRAPRQRRSARRRAPAKDRVQRRARRKPSARRKK